MNLPQYIAREVRDILASHGLPDSELTISDGFANLVVLTPNHVVRLNGGRFPNAFRHEAEVLSRLPVAIPHPVAVAQGVRATGGEYLVLERLPGDNLQSVWPSLSPNDRNRIVGDLAGITRRLHRLPVAGWMRNEWVEGALAAGRWGDAYHAPPAASAGLIASARAARPDVRSVLADMSRFFEERRGAFDDEETGFVHTDLHFRNVIVDEGRITGLIDYEGSRVCPIDVELDMLLRTLAPPDPGPESFVEAVATFRAGYPELFAHPDLVARLEVYEALWHLVQLYNWSKGDRWMRDPADHLQDVVRGAFGERMRQVLMG